MLTPAWVRCVFAPLRGVGGVDLALLRCGCTALRCGWAWPGLAWPGLALLCCVAAVRGLGGAGAVWVRCVVVGGVVVGVACLVALSYLWVVGRVLSLVLGAVGVVSQYVASVGGAGVPVEELLVGDRVVRVTNPQRVYFSARGETKLDLARYYLSVGSGVVNALRERPCMMHRFPGGVDGEKVHQKRLPRGAPPWVETVRVHFPRYGRHADELCVTELASVIWAVQMSCVEFHPWNSRRVDTEKPDEWRIDLDPMPGATFDTVRQVALVVREVLDELGAVGFPKTSGGKGLHIYVRVLPSFGFSDVRRAAHAFAREVERRASGLVDLTWWRKDRDPSTVFVDYNQNARDHTIRSAYSVIGVPEARVSTPIRWDEVADVDPRDFTIATVPKRFAEVGDLHASIDSEVFDLRVLLEWADRDGQDIPDLDE